MKELDSTMLALVGIQCALDSIGTKATWMQAMLGIGRGIEREAFAAGLLKHDKKLAKAIAEDVKHRRGGVDRRTQFAKDAAARAGFAFDEWRPDFRTVADSWLLDVVLSSVPDLIEVTGDGEYKRLSITEGGAELAAKAVRMCVRQAYKPQVTAPAPWTSLEMKLRDGRVRLVKSAKKDVRQAVEAAIAAGTMTPALEAINALQATPKPNSPTSEDSWRRTVVFSAHARPSPPSPPRP